MAIFMLALFATYCYVVDISLIQGIDALHVYPLLLVLGMFSIALYPFDFFWRSSRKYGEQSLHLWDLIMILTCCCCCCCSTLKPNQTTGSSSWQCSAV